MTNCKYVVLNSQHVYEIHTLNSTMTWKSSSLINWFCLTEFLSISVVVVEQPWENQCKSTTMASLHTLMFQDFSYSVLILVKSLH